MNTFEINIQSTIIQRIVVEAADRDEAVEKATEVAAWNTYEHETVVYREWDYA